MSKSLGNFYTLRDLVLKGHKPSSIRYLLASVPYRNQLNFTWDGLQQAAASVERLRNFRARLENGRFPAGVSATLFQHAQNAGNRMTSALEDDLNTAQAQAAIFDLVRVINTAMDAGQVWQDDVPHLLHVLNRFDEIFAVLKNDDAEKIKLILDWAEAEGRIEKKLGDQMQMADGVEQNLSDSAIETKISEMTAARQSRNFQLSDTIRAELTAAGILVEITKEGIRWRRK